jgi:hypothetical protein
MRLKRPARISPTSVQLHFPPCFSLKTPKPDSERIEQKKLIDFRFMEVLFSALWASLAPSHLVHHPLSFVFMLVDCRISFRFTHQSTEVVAEAEKGKMASGECLCVSMAGDFNWFTFRN